MQRGAAAAELSMVAHDVSVRSPAFDLDQQRKNFSFNIDLDQQRKGPWQLV